MTETSKIIKELEKWYVGSYKGSMQFEIPRKEWEKIKNGK